MNIREHLKYTKDHEWLKLLDDGEAIIGITDFAQRNLGDITYVDVPEVGASFEAGATFGVVESVKAASDLYMPVDAEILEGNAVLEDAPEKVNQSPFEDGWIARIKIQDPSQLSGLLDAAGYAAITAD